MKILCIYSNTYHGGTETVLLNGLPFLNRVSDVHVTFRDLYSRAAVNRKFEERGIATWRGGNPSGSSIVSLRSGLRRRLDVVAAIPRHLGITAQLRAENGAFDVLYMHGYKDLLLCQAARLSSLRRHPPMVWHCHGLDDGTPPPMTSMLANRCAKVIAISEDVRQHLVDIGVKASLVRTIYNAVDSRRIGEAALLPPTRALPSTGGRKIILVCPATLRPIKGLHLAIEALGTLPADVDLWITGDPDSGATTYFRRLQSLIASGGLGQRVYFLGNRTDLPAVMTQASVVCVPSVCREGFSLVAGEAMALGKVVVASSRGALPEVVKDGESGLIFDPDRPGDLSRKLALAFADPSLAAWLGAAAKQSVLKRFSYERWAHEMITELRAAARCHAAVEPGIVESHLVEPRINGVALGPRPTGDAWK